MVRVQIVGLTPQQVDSQLFAAVLLLLWPIHFRGGRLGLPASKHIDDNLSTKSNERRTTTQQASVHWDSRFVLENTTDEMAAALIEHFQCFHGNLLCSESARDCVPHYIRHRSKFSFALEIFCLWIRDWMSLFRTLVLFKTFTVVNRTASPSWRWFFCFENLKLLSTSHSHVFQAVFLYCCLECQSCPANAI